MTQAGATNSSEFNLNSTEQENTETGRTEAQANAASAGVEPGVGDAQKRIAELEAAVKEKEGKYLYLYAEFENFKKRSIKERSDLIKFGWENVARDLLEVIDNLERALAHLPQTDHKSAMAEGLKMVLNQFKAALEKQGVQPIQAVRQAFDPNLHEAVGQTPSDEPSGVVIQEASKGYTLHGRLLRPSRVIVSSGKG